MKTLSEVFKKMEKILKAVVECENKSKKNSRLKFVEMKARQYYDDEVELMKAHLKRHDYC